MQKYKKSPRNASDPIEGLEREDDTQIVPVVDDVNGLAIQFHPLYNSWGYSILTIKDGQVVDRETPDVSQNLGILFARLPVIIEQLIKRGRQ